MYNPTDFRNNEDLFINKYISFVIIGAIFIQLVSYQHGVMGMASPLLEPLDVLYLIIQIGLST